jgi:hypothetical protein
MKIESATSLAFFGIQRGMEGVRRNAEKIAGADQVNSRNPGAKVEALVDLKENQLQVSASTKLLSAIDDMIGTLIDDEA